MENTSILNYQEELETLYRTCGPADLNFVRNWQASWVKQHSEGYTNPELREATYKAFQTKKLEINGK